MHNIIFKRRHFAVFWRECLFEGACESLDDAFFGRFFVHEALFECANAFFDALKLFMQVCLSFWRDWGGCAHRFGDVLGRITFFLGFPAFAPVVEQVEYAEDEGCD